MTPASRENRARAEPMSQLITFEAFWDGTVPAPRLLVDHREDLVAERTRAMHRLRWHLHELLPA